MTDDELMQSIAAYASSRGIPPYRLVELISEFRVHLSNEQIISTATEYALKLGLRDHSFSIRKCAKQQWCVLVILVRHK